MIKKQLYCFLLFLCFINFFISQNTNDIAYMFEGEVNIDKETETTLISGNIDNGLFIEININNKNYKFLVDTGSYISVLDTKTFEDIIDSKKKIKSGDAIGNVEEKDMFYLNFKIVEKQFSNFAFIKYDLSKFLTNNCSKFDGILGANVLRKLNWKYVKAEDKLYFSKNLFPYEGFDKPAKIQWSGNIPLVELNISDFKFLAIFDSGHFGTFNIPKDFYIKEFGFGTYYNSIEGKGNPVLTINGSQKVILKKALLKNFSLENYDFSGYEVILTTNIGNKIILENGFIFNFLNNEIAFGKNEGNSKYAILPKIKICKSEKNSNQIELCFFWDEKENRKLKIGDQIIKIDSFDTKNLSNEEFCNLKENVVKNKKSMKLILKRGSNIFENIIK